MNIRNSCFIFGVFFFINKGCFGASLRSLTKDVSASKSKDAADDKTLSCILELVNVIASPSENLLSPDCEKLMTSMKQTNELKLQDVLEPEDLTEELNSLIMNNLPQHHYSSKYARARNEDENEDDKNEVTYYGRKLPNHFNSALKHLVNGNIGSDDIAADSDFTDLLDEPNMRFGEPFVTALKGFKDKFLIVPINIDKQVPLVKPDNDENDDIMQMLPNTQDAKDFGELPNFERLSEHLAQAEDGNDDYFEERRSDDDGLTDNNQIDISDIWADPNLLESKKMESNEESIYKIEMDLKKLNSDLEGLKGQ